LGNVCNRDPKIQASAQLLDRSVVNVSILARSYFCLPEAFDPITSELLEFVAKSIASKITMARVF
jgi:hypothetical protein